MTWKEFKDCVEAQGVEDGHVFLYIDVGGWDEVFVHFDKDDVDGRFYVNDCD